jgi:hypothetical protein
MSTSTIDKTIASFYTSAHDGSSIADRWNEALPVGARIVPSVYVPGYREFIINILTDGGRLPLECAIVSIGSGSGTVETDLLARGYTNLVSLEVFDTFIEHQRRLGLNAINLSAFDLSKLGRRFDRVYLDGSLGHLATTYKQPFDGCLKTILSVIGANMSPDGLVVTSDDPPYRPVDYEVHDLMSHLRLSALALARELHSAGFLLQATHAFDYQRPTIGTVRRRIAVARLAAATVTTLSTL